MKYIIASLVLISFLQCKKNKTVAPVTQSYVTIGFNQNWSFLPQFSNTMLTNINSLKPQMIRYPGGTVAHEWDWITGRRDNAPNTIAHPVADIKSLVQATNAKMIFVLNILNRSITDQINMLNAIKALGIPIEHIELGNELYANDQLYIDSFPTGTKYAAKANQWIPQLRAAFPGVKIAALLQGRNNDATNPRFRNWNNEVVAGTINTVNAFTYHIYIATGSSYATRITEFEEVVQATNTGAKDLWITEYGNQNDITDPNYYKALDSLANYVEQQPKIKIALNHLLVGNNKNKISADGLNFTTEGNLFLTRASKR